MQPTTLSHGRMDSEIRNTSFILLQSATTGSWIDLTATPKQTNGRPSPSIWLHRCNIRSHFIWWVLSNNIRFKMIRTPCHRYLLPDIRFVPANPTQENRSMERRIPIRAHCKFYSVHGVFDHPDHPGSVFYHCESYSSSSRTILSMCHGSEYKWLSADFRISR